MLAPLSVMIPAVARGLFLLFCGLFCDVLASGQSLDDAVAALAKRVSARLAATETARVTSRNLSSLPAADAAKALAGLNRALQRRVRNPAPVDVALTISENLRGYLLVVEIRRDSEMAVEMAEFRSVVAAAPPRPAFAFERKLLWEQDTPILDVFAMGDQMLVLDTAGVSRYERNAGKWERAESAAIPSNVRDPRGRIEVTGESVTVHLPGTTCAGSLKLVPALQCEDGGLFTAARNTLDMHDWRGPFFASAQIGGDTLVAELDSRTHVYDAGHAPQAAFDGWGSDFVALTACGATHVAATSGGESQAADSVALYEMINRTPTRASELVEFPGPITALWPQGEAALAVSRNLSTGKYAAYSLTVGCSR